MTSSPVNSSFAECSLPTFDTTSTSLGGGGLADVQQAMLLRKIEEEKMRILEMHRRQQELFQNGLLFGTPYDPSSLALQQMVMQQHQRTNANMVYALSQQQQQLPGQLPPQPFPRHMSPRQATQHLPPQQQLLPQQFAQSPQKQLVPQQFVRPEPMTSPFMPITQRSTPVDTSPLSHKSPLAVNFYLDQQLLPSSVAAVPVSPLGLAAGGAAGHKQESERSTPRQDLNHDVIQPVNLPPPPPPQGAAAPTTPEETTHKKEGGRRMSELSAAQKLASIVEESEHDSLSTSGTFTDSSKGVARGGQKRALQQV